MEKIKLVSHLGILRISQSIPELNKALTYRLTYVEDKGSVSFMDKATGKEKTVKRKGFIKTKTEKLYNESEGQVFTHDGMLSKIAKKIHTLGLEFDYERLDPQWPVPLINASIVKGLYPEQKECVIKMLSSVGGCLVQAATSAGKTRIIASLILAYPNSNIVIMTHRQSVVRGLISNLTSLLQDKGIEVGICQGVNTSIKRVTVSTIGSAHKLDKDKVDILIGDEFHRFAGEQASSMWLSFNKAVKYGLSATITERFDGKFNYFESLCGPLVFELTDQELQDAGRVPPLDVFFIAVPEGPPVDHIIDSVKRKKIGIWKNSIRNQMIKDIVDCAPADQQLMIFCETVQHLEELKKLMPEMEVCHAQLGTKDRKEIEQKFVSGEAKRILSTDVLSEGVDPRKLMILIDPSSVKGDSAMVQKRGRLRRPGKEKGILINFSDDWSEALSNKAKKRIKDHKDRGDNVIIVDDIKQITFV